jgi:predicted phage terminase large subunit-like protein
MTIYQPYERDAIFRNDLHAFSWKAYEVLNPASRWLDNWHLEAITYRLLRVMHGQCKRLIINLPPRSLKSHLGSISFPAFLLGKDPTSKIICVSYSQDLAVKHAADCKRLIESQFFQNLFPHVRLLKSTENELATDQGGFRLATSVGGTITGRGGNLIIIDDPLNASDGYSKVQREAVNEWFFSTLISRLDHPNTDAIIVIKQRLHEDDLVGRIRQKGDWDILALSAIAPHDEEIPLSSRRTHRRKKDEVLHEEHTSRATLDSRKRELGTDFFNAQYLQAPLPETGNMIKRHWLKFLDPFPVRQQGDQIVQSWDTALKATDSSDYSACLTFQIRNKNEYYLLDAFHERLEFPELLKHVISRASKFQANTILIEEHASGASLVQMVRHAGLQGVIPIKHSSDKLTRMMCATPKIEAGSLFLPRSAPWLESFLAEALAFPGGRYDDYMDALSQFLNWRVNQEDCFFEADFGYEAEPGAPDPKWIAWMKSRY